MRTKISVFVIALILIGFALPKLTARDLVQASPKVKECVAYAIERDYPRSTLERIALSLGKVQILSATAASAEVKLFTVFRIPLAVLRGQPDMRLNVNCHLPGDPKSSSLTITNLPPLVDGQVTIFGRFHDSPVVSEKKAYGSEIFGVAFKYPADHLLFENTVEGHTGAGVEGTIVIAPETPARETMARVTGGEGPASIFLTFYREPRSAALEDWIRTNPRSNFMPWNEESDTLTPTIVAGRPAFRYQTDGLYNSNTVVFTHREWIVLVSSAGLSGTDEQDFQTVLSSIRFED